MENKSFIINSPQFNMKELKTNDFVLIRTRNYDVSMFPKRNSWYKCLVVKTEKFCVTVGFVTENHCFVKETISIDDVVSGVYEIRSDFY